MTDRRDPAPTPPAAPPMPASPSHVDALGTVACVLLALVTIGFAAFRRLAETLPTGASHNVDRTFFTSVNAVTLTGFEQSFAQVPNFPAAGKWLLATLAVGGAMTTLIGGALFVRSIVGATVRTRTIVLLCAATLALPVFVTLPIGALDAASSATTLGLSGRYSVGPVALALLVAASVPAAIGPLAAIAVGTRTPNASLLRATVVAWVAVYVVATIVLALVGSFGLDSAGASPPTVPSAFARQAHAASMLAVNARAAGLNDAWPGSLGAAAQWTLVALMAIGSTPGGVAGGIGLLPLVIVGRHASDAIRGRPASRLAGVAIVWVAAWVASLVVATIALAATQSQLPGDRLLFIAVSALSNVGLSHDPIGLTGVGLFTLAVTMIVGRLLPLAMLCWMATLADRTRAPS